MESLSNRLQMHCLRWARPGLHLQLDLWTLTFGEHSPQTEYYMPNALPEMGPPRSQSSAPPQMGTPGSVSNTTPGNRTSLPLLSPSQPLTGTSHIRRRRINFPLFLAFLNDDFTVSRIRPRTKSRRCDQPCFRMRHILFSLEIWHYKNAKRRGTFIVRGQIDIYLNLTDGLHLRVNVWGDVFNSNRDNMDISMYNRLDMRVNLSTHRLYMQCIQ